MSAALSTIIVLKQAERGIWEVRKMNHNGLSSWTTKGSDKEAVATFARKQAMRKNLLFLDWDRDAFLSIMQLPITDSKWYRPVKVLRGKNFEINEAVYQTKDEAIMACKIHARDLQLPFLLNFYLFAESNKEIEI